MTSLIGNHDECMYLFLITKYCYKKKNNDVEDPPRKLFIGENLTIMH